MIGCAGYVLEPDEFDTVRIAGEPQSAPSHEKLRSKENVKRKKRPVANERETITAPSSLVLVFLVAKSRKKVNNKSERKWRGSAFFVALFPAWARARSQEPDEETHI